MSNTKTVMSQAANTLAKPLEVEDVFSTYLYTGNGSTQTITNGIDLDGEGGLVWTKSRSMSSAGYHQLIDTVRGVGKFLSSDLTQQEYTDTQTISAFNSTGYAIGNDAQVNTNNETFASWTFRKAPKFFDVVTWTGDGVAGRTISHNLNNEVGMIIVKRTNGSFDWICQHRSLSAGYVLYLNQTSAQDNNPGAFTTTLPTSSVFSVGDNNKTNESGGEYVAYLFAHNDGDGEFGPDGDADIIKCGSIVGNGTSDREIDLGFEPQWLLIRRSNSGGSWALHDNMRGMIVGGADPYLLAQDNSAEGSDQNYFEVTPNGFKVGTAGASGYAYNESGDTYIYMAIRRGTKVPESATEVFDVGLRSGSSSDANTTSDILTDASIIMRRDSSSEYNLAGTRLQGLNNLFPESTSAEGAGAIDGWDTMSGLIVNGSNGAVNTGSLVDFSWKRAPGFFDAVAYTGNGVQGRNITHNLGVTPDMIWVKNRDDIVDWAVYVSGITHLSVFGSDPDNYGDNPARLELNTTEQAQFSSSGVWDHTHPTDTVFRVGDTNATNGTGDSLIAYLFASLPGISKVGNYTGNGSSQTIDCGFTSGARFVLIKRTDSSGSWFVWDAERGIVSGNEPYLTLNQTAAEDSGSDTVDPNSSGFTVNETNYLNQNTSGASYIFYAIA